ncbi:MAG: glutathione peroxidase [Acidobacteriaceae bacterium]
MGRQILVHRQSRFKNDEFLSTYYNGFMSTAIQQIPLRRISGEETNLGQYGGKVLLVVNVASKCGLTKQYEGLEKLYRDYRNRGLVVAGFPANDFKSQEPGSNADIASFCSSNYGVDFPMFEKITVVGGGKHPLYKELIAAQPKAVSTSETPFAEDLKRYGIQPNPEPEILWNFEKFLVDRKGNVTARFAPNTTPDDPQLVKAVEEELAK